MIKETHLLLDTHQKTGEFLTDISEKISERINFYKYQLLDYLETVELNNESLIQCILNYAPPLLRKKYKEKILQIPDIHKKAIVSCYLASHLVYKWGLDWSPTIADVLPQLAEDPDIISWKLNIYI